MSATASVPFCSVPRFATSACSCRSNASNRSISSVRCRAASRTTRICTNTRSAASEIARMSASVPALSRYLDLLDISGRKLTGLDDCSRAASVVARPRCSVRRPRPVTSVDLSSRIGGGSCKRGEDGCKRQPSGQQDEIVQTQVCRTEEEVLTTGETWKAKMIEKGWA